MVSPNDKEKLIEELKKSYVIQVACMKTGIARASYYRWLHDDPDFARMAREAVEQGREYMNDMAESVVISAIKNKDMGATKYYLGHNHPRYMKKEKLDEERKFTPIESIEHELFDHETHKKDTEVDDAGELQSKQIPST